MNASKINSGHLASLKKRRKLWLKVHLYLGLFAGAILLVIGLTGSILSFWLDIDRWLNPNLMVVDVPSHAVMRPLAEIVDAANSAMPVNAKFSYAYPPHHPEQAGYFFYKVPADETGNRHSMNVFVNPYTAKVIGTRVFYHATDLFSYCFIGFIFRLHYALLAGDSGMILVGILGVLFLISVMTGVIVWWPLTGKWLKSLTIKRRGSAERLNHDLHKSFGFYSTPVLLAVFLSGISMNLPDQFTWLVERFSTVTAVKDYKTQPREDKPSVSVDHAWHVAQKLYPASDLFWFSIPDSATGVYEFNFKASLGTGFHGVQKVVIDRYGEVLHAFDSLSGTGGNVFMQWMWPLHSGYVLGMPGRILVLLSGIACAVLFITGMIRWLQKRRASQKKRHKVDGIQIKTGEVDDVY